MKPQTPYLKLAEVTDIPAIVDMAQKFHSVSVYKDQPFDPRRAEETAAAIMMKPQSEGVIFLAMVDGTPIGVVVAVAATNTFNYDKHSFELIWWLDPEHRKGSIGITLLNAYEYWAEKVAGCRIIGLDRMYESMDLDTYYRRRKYTPGSCNYIKVL